MRGLAGFCRIFVLQSTRNTLCIYLICKGLGSYAHISCSYCSGRQSHIVQLAPMPSRLMPRHYAAMHPGDGHARCDGR